MSDGTRDTAFLTLSLNHVQGDLLSLYQRIACEKGRVEITGGDGACACVLISKAELDSLETALAVLSDGETVQALHKCLAQVAAATDTQGVAQMIAVE